MGSMDCILVAGGAGFIGSNFVRQWLTEEDSAVLVVDKLTYAGNLDSLDGLPNGASGYSFVEGDIGDGAAMARLLAEYRPRAIVNFAAESHVDRSIDGPAPFIETNIVGVFRLLEAARLYYDGLDATARSRFRFLQVSTDEVFGSLGESGRFSESSAYAPNSPYAASKAAGDHLVRAYHRTFGLPSVVTHCSNNYGPYQFPEKLIPLATLNALEGRTIPVYGDGLQVRDWLYVDDHCEALRRVLAAGSLGDAYNIGGNCELTNLAVVESICRVVDELFPHQGRRCESLIRFVADRPGHDRRYAIDAGKAERTLGWSPREAFESGLRKTVRWYGENRSWVTRVTSGKYRRQRLGLAGAPER